MGPLGRVARAWVQRLNCLAVSSDWKTLFVAYESSIYVFSLLGSLLDHSLVGIIPSILGSNLGSDGHGVVNNIECGFLHGIEYLIAVGENSKVAFYPIERVQLLEGPPVMMIEYVLRQCSVSAPTVPSQVLLSYCCFPLFLLLLLLFFCFCEWKWRTGRAFGVWIDSKICLSIATLRLWKADSTTSSKDRLLFRRVGSAFLSYALSYKPSWSFPSREERSLSGITSPSKLSVRS